MQKYEEYYQKMVDDNKELFNKFFAIHDKYVMNPEENQKEFNTIGREIQDVIREYERKLCNHSERGKFGKFSANLADRFWAQVRKDFPKIDMVGVTIG